MVRAAIKWSDLRNWDEVPADLAQRMRTLIYVHDIFRGMRAAGAQNMAVAWAQQHPEQWDLASEIMYGRRLESRGQS